MSVAFVSPQLIVALTLGSCLVTASSRIVLQRGFRYSNSLTAMVCTLFFGWIALGTLCAVFWKDQRWSSQGLLFFAGIGIVAPPVVRFLTYIGVEKVGPSRADAVRSLTPLFALGFAGLFAEQVTRFSWAATLLVIAGVWLIGRDGKKRAGVFSPQHLLYPFTAAVIAGLIANLRKLGTSLEITPMLAAFTAASSALVVFSLFLLVTQKWKKLLLPRQAVLPMVSAGVLVSATDVLDLVLLKVSKVSVISPLLATTPLFVILLSAIFLRGIEQLTANLVAGALAISTGVIILYLGLVP